MSSNPIDTARAVRDAHDNPQPDAIRDAGSPAELAAQQRMANELQSIGATVTTHTFRVHPRATVAWTYCWTVLLTLGWVLFFICPAATLICIVLAALTAFLQKVLCLPIVDKLFDPRESVNVVATLAPQGETRRRVVFNAHPDATYQRHWHTIGGRMAYCLMSIALPMLGMLYLAVLATIAVCTRQAVSTPHGNLLYAGLASTLFVPIWAMFCYHADCDRTVRDTSDNLDACRTAIRIAQALSEDSARPEHTEITILLTGAKYAGLCGAKAFVREHPHFGAKHDLPTVFVTLDTMDSADRMTLLYRDLNGWKRQSRAACALVQQAAKDELGNAMPNCTSLCFVTDAAALSKKGRQAVAITANPYLPRPLRFAQPPTQADLDSVVRLGVAIARAADRQTNEHPAAADTPTATEDVQLAAQTPTDAPAENAHTQN